MKADGWERWARGRPCCGNVILQEVLGGKVPMDALGACVV